MMHWTSLFFLVNVYFGALLLNQLFDSRLFYVKNVLIKNPPYVLNQVTFLRPFHAALAFCFNYGCLHFGC